MSTSVALATEQTLPIRRVAPQAPPLRWRILAIAAIVVAAFNARTAVTAVGAALPEIRAALGLGTAAVSVLTALPALCIAATTFLVPLLRQREGTLTSVVLFLGVLLAGQAVRITHGQWSLLAGTVLACCAIGGLQVLLPAVCQQFGGSHAAALTTLSASVIGAGAATATATTPWLTSIGGWRTGLGAWLLPVALALLLWLPLSRTTTSIAAPQLALPRRGSLLRSARAWYLTMFMGLQSLQALSLLSWQPVLLRTTGVGPVHAAALSAGTLVVSIVASAVITASCYRNAALIGTWMVLTTSSGGIGLFGLLIAPSTAPVVWAGLLGVGMSALAPAMAAIPAHTTDSGETTRLSAMTQGYGYLLAALGPALIGALTDASATADWALTALLFFSLLQFLFATLAARPPHDLHT
ncbi:MFS transporter [Saccharopolyspora hirsuta]|uniref:MFS transporter n=1 Tax=Saccharopolyspora hirsuta TaxID=1837 RepID=A0A5M7BPR4_SACHI|nr:MFS transporter [Saccharopolyspora hirsuta]KAA5828365.1 MFS transporter [Saccharopolyspora hirsuta]